MRSVTALGKCNIEDNHDDKSDVLCNFQRFEDKVESMNSATSQGTAFIYAKVKHITSENIPTLVYFPPSICFRSSICGPCKDIQILSSLYPYDDDVVKLQKTPVDRVLEKYISVELNAHILYFSNNLGWQDIQKKDVSTA